MLVLTPSRLVLSTVIFTLALPGCGNEGGSGSPAGGAGANAVGAASSGGTPSTNGGNVSGGAAGDGGSAPSAGHGGAGQSGGGQTAGGAGAGGSGSGMVKCDTPPSAAPASTWVNATGNLANMASECGNLGLISAQPCSNRVIAGIAKKGLWQTVDGGKTWTALGTGAGSAVITNRISAIVYDPMDPKIFWESGIYNGGGIYKTVDSGTTFEQLGDITHCDSVSVDLSDPERKTLIAGTHENNTPLHYSKDGGKVWSNIANALPAGYCTATLALSATNFLVACADNIMRTTNAGAQWDVAAGSKGGVFQPLLASDGAIYWPGTSGGVQKSTGRRAKLRERRHGAAVTGHRRSCPIRRATGRAHRHQRHRPSAGLGRQRPILDADRRRAAFRWRRLRRHSWASLFGADQDVLRLALGLHRQRARRRHHEHGLRLGNAIAQFQSKPLVFPVHERRMLSMRFLGTVCVGASLFIACDDREDRIPGRGDAGTEPAAAGGQPEQSEASAGMAAAFGSESAAARGGVTGEGGVGNSGGVEGMTEGEPCDGHDPDACLDEVTGKPGEVGWAFKSSWFLSGCLEMQETRMQIDCLVPYNPVDAATYERHGVVNEAVLPIGGDRGQTYKVSFTFNAIAEAKAIDGGLRDQADQAHPADDGTYDTFHRDGTPAIDSYNEWQLSVLDELGQPARHYFMNSFPKSGGPGVTGGFEGHRTYLLSYSKSIVVVGGGSVVLRVHDGNSRARANCGEEADCVPRYVPNEPTDLELPVLYPNYEHVGGGFVPLEQLNLTSDTATQPWQSQLGHLTVTAVEPTTEPATHDFLD